MAIPLSTATTTYKTSMFNRAESTPRVHGQLCLRFEAPGDRNQTILAESKQQLPLRIVRAFQLDDGGALVHLHNLSGGVLGGDHLDLAIDVSHLNGRHSNLSQSKKCRAGGAETSDRCSGGRSCRISP